MEPHPEREDGRAKAAAALTRRTGAEDGPFRADGDERLAARNGLTPARRAAGDAVGASIGGGRAVALVAVALVAVALDGRTVALVLAGLLARRPELRDDGVRSAEPADRALRAVGVRSCLRTFGVPNDERGSAASHAAAAASARVARASARSASERARASSRRAAFSG